MTNPAHVSALVTYTIRSVATLCVAAGLAGCAPSDARDEDYGTPTGSSALALSTGTPLSAYFGGNNVPGLAALANCDVPLNNRYDGVPVLFPTEIDPSTVLTSSFAIKRNGRTYRAQCATLLPATSSYSAAAGYVMYDSDQARSFENRTVLLAFDGAALDATSTTGVTITGDVLSEDGAITYRGSTARLIPYGTGPSIGHARRMATAETPVGSSAQRVGSLCPAGTTDAVLIAWQGGVTVNGRELTEADVDRGYRMTITHTDGSVEQRAPDGLGDTNGDDDNNQIVCLVGDGRITRVDVLASTVTDPSGFWNPATSAEVQ